MVAGGGVLTVTGAGACGAGAGVGIVAGGNVGVGVGVGVGVETGVGVAEDAITGVAMVNVVYELTEITACIALDNPGTVNVVGPIAYNDPF